MLLKFYKKNMYLKSTAKQDVRISKIVYTRNVSVWQEEYKVKKQIVPYFQADF